MELKYQFITKPWQYSGPNCWHFVSLPKKLSGEIRKALKNEEQGWGRINVTAKIGSSEWKTSIWFDTKHKAYLLTLKSEIRRKEEIVSDKIIKVSVTI